MLMVVFGAGASYDSSPDFTPPKSAIEEISLSSRQLEEVRPPLANELFENRPTFAKVLERFPICWPVIPYLRKEGIVVEEVLQRLLAESKDDPYRLRQLAGIRYYLQVILAECVGAWRGRVTRGVTNYGTLLDQVRASKWSSCLVTFNYDTMIEEALRESGRFKFTEIADYIAGNELKLIKLHGSVNWARYVETNIPRIAERPETHIVDELINRVSDLRISDIFAISTARPIYRIGNQAALPALAIPVRSKTRFECPRDHVSALENCIPQVTKLLIVGWRGMEESFLEMLQKGLKRDVCCWVVSGPKPEDVQQTYGQFERIGLSFKQKGQTAGFTNFVMDRILDSFLKA